MKNIRSVRNSVFLITNLFIVTSCEKSLSENHPNSSTVSINSSQEIINIHSRNGRDNAENNSVDIISSSGDNDTYSHNSTDHQFEEECPEPKCETEFVLLKNDEYRKIDDGRLYANLHNKIFEKCEFVAIEGGVAVCPSKLLETQNEYDGILTIINVIGLSTSMVFIVLHLVLFLFIPKLQNLPGCYLASLCLALVFAHINFLVATTIENLSKTSCIGVAMCIYYFFLASFFWMNVIAFDVWRSLRAATTRLRVMDNKLPKRRFFFYSLYAWLTPMSLAILTQQIDASDYIPLKYRPQFADGETGMCWFREPHSLLLLFIIPFAVLMCLNILLFGISAYFIVTMFSNSPEANKKMLLIKFCVFLRLAAMMGLTWVSGIIVSFTDSTFMKYVFVISNAFQGLFIFLAFSCKTTVKENFVERMRTLTSTKISRSKRIVLKPNLLSPVEDIIKIKPIPITFRFECD